MMAAVPGRHRKTHPFRTEMLSRGGWVTTGDEICVVETDLGHIGIIICFDGDYPELSRITAVRGAEVIVRRRGPSSRVGAIPGADQPRAGVRQPCLRRRRQCDLGQTLQGRSILGPR